MQRSTAPVVAVVLVAATLGTVAVADASGVGQERGVERTLGNATTTGVADDAAVRIVVRYPTGDGYRNRTVVTGEDFLTVGEVTVDRAGVPYVPVRLTDEGAGQFARRLRESGITTEGIDDCRWEVREGHCLLVVSRGRVVHSSGVTAGIAEQLNTGAFLERPTFRLTAGNESEARSIRRALLGRPPRTAATTGGGGDGPLGDLPVPAVLVGAGLVVVLSGLVLFGRGSGDGGTEGDADRDGSRYGSREDRER